MSVSDAAYNATFEIERQLAEEAAHLLDLAEKIKEDAAEALDWSDRAFLAAARVRCFRRFLSIVSGSRHGLEKAVHYAEQEASQGARFPSHSTSIPSNLIHQYETKTWAELAADYGGVR